MNASAGFDFTDYEVLVVGASRGGIGSAVARAFQDAGANVRITGVEPEPLESEGHSFAYIQLDVTDPDAISRLADGIYRLDILVNCAAITVRDEEMAPDFFAHVVNINLHGTFRMSTALLDPLRASQGCVINFASMYSEFASPSNPAYGASKAAVRQLTKSLAAAWAQFGIRVNSVSPGFIVTEQSARSRTNPEHVAKVNARTPMGRWGQPDDLAGPVLFLASPAAAFMTGTSLVVDGGYSIV